MGANIPNIPEDVEFEAMDLMDFLRFVTSAANGNPMDPATRIMRNATYGKGIIVEASKSLAIDLHLSLTQAQFATLMLGLEVLTEASPDPNRPPVRRTIPHEAPMIAHTMREQLIDMMELPINPWAGPNDGQTATAPAMDEPEEVNTADPNYCRDCGRVHNKYFG